MLSVSVATSLLVLPLCMPVNARRFHSHFKEQSDWTSLHFGGLHCWTYRSAWKRADSEEKRHCIEPFLVAAL